MRAALYARVSSQAQRDRDTIESQLRVLPAFASSRGWEIVGTYVDDGFSARAGKLQARGGFADLLRDAAAAAFDVVVVWDVDRLTRSEDLVERYAIVGALQRAGVLLACAASGSVHDLNSSEGDLQVVIGSYFAAEWARKHRKRVVEGKLTAIARGKKPAGPTPYGYRYDRQAGAWSVCEAEAEVVREIFDRFLAGESAQVIADELFARSAAPPRGTWDRGTVYRILRQPAYRGEWIADKRRKLVVPTPVIVEPDTWYAVRAKGAERAKAALRRRRHVYLIEDLAVCALCGSPIRIASGTPQRRGGTYPARYVCARRRRRTRDEEPCRAPYWLTDEVDARVWKALSLWINDPNRLERVVRKRIESATAERETWRADLQQAERRLAQLTRAEAAILDRLSRGLVSEAAFDLHLEQSRAARAQAQAQLDAARGAQFAAGRATTRATELQELVRELRRMATEASPEKRRELVMRLLPRGSVVMSIATIEVRAPLRRAPLSGPVAVPGSSCDNGTILTFRLVA